MVESSSSYDALIAKNFETFLSAISADGWKSEVKTAFYELSLKEATPVNMVKITGTFNCSASKLKDILFDATVLTKYDDSKESRTEIEAGANYKVFHTKGVKVFMVDPRDTVMLLAYKTQTDGSILISGASIEHPAVLPVKGRVRAQIDITGYLLEVVPGDANKCKFTYAGKMDPKGNVPGMMVNKMIKKQGENMEKLDAFAAKY